MQSPGRLGLTDESAPPLLTWQVQTMDRNRRVGESKYIEADSGEGRSAYHIWSQPVSEQLQEPVGEGRLAAAPLAQDQDHCWRDDDLPPAYVGFQRGSQCGPTGVGNAGESGWGGMGILPMA